MATPDRPRAVAYLRVSTHMQERDGVSLDAQLDMARSYAEARGFELAQVFTDVMSGTRADRPGLTALEAGIKARAFDYVLVYRVDRLGRDSAHYHAVLQDLDRADIGLISMTQPIDGSTPTGRFMLSILISVAQNESETIGERVRDSIRYRARGGGLVVGRHVPFGYTYQHASKGEGGRVPGELSIEPREAEVVRFMFESYMATRSIQATVRACQDAGLTNRGGEPIKRGLVATVLSNPVCRGELVVGRTRQARKRGRKVQVKTAPETWVRVPGRVPAIVDDATWQAVQDLLAAQAKGPRAAMAGRGRNVWTGLLRCASCGGGMVRTTKAAGNPGARPLASYRCMAPHVHGNRGDCPEPQWVSEEPLTLFAAPDILRAADVVGRERARKAAGTTRRAPAPPTPADELVKLERRRQRLRELYELGDMPMDEYKAKSAAITARVEAVLAASVTKPAEAAPQPPTGLLETWRRHVGDPAARNKLLAALVDHVVVTTGKRLHVVFRAYDHPAWPEVLDLPIVDMRSSVGRRAKRRPAGPLP